MQSMNTRPHDPPAPDATALLREAEARSVVCDDDRLRQLIKHSDVDISPELARCMRNLDAACRLDKRAAINAILATLCNLQDRLLYAARKGNP